MGVGKLGIYVILVLLTQVTKKDVRLLQLKVKDVDLGKTPIQN